MTEDIRKELNEEELRDAAGGVDYGDLHKVMRNAPIKERVLSALTTAFAQDQAMPDGDTNEIGTHHARGSANGR